jgi:hypothetical protein
MIFSLKYFERAHIFVKMSKHARQQAEVLRQQPTNIQHVFV